MKAIAIALPCLIAGSLVGALNLSTAAPNGGGDLFQQQLRRVNIVSVLKMDGTTEHHGCVPGLAVMDCIPDSISGFDTDTTFSLLSAGGSIHCGSVSMAVNTTCTYANAVYGLDCDDRCGSPIMSADQTQVAPQ
jgi:hypothetical protein